MKAKTVLSWLIGCTVMAGALGASAEDLDAVKARMLKRKPELQALMDARLVGENGAGMCEARGSLTAQQAAIVAAENADRKQVYAAIAAKTGASIEQVGKQRAAAIAGKSGQGKATQPDGGQGKKGK